MWTDVLCVPHSENFMSTNLIDNMSEREAKHLLNDIASVFKIGGKARSASVILTNVKNSADHAFCRSRTENLENMLKDKLDLIKCGIATNYSGNPRENELYTSVIELLEDT